ncbi:hypothetical protein STANM309S_03028 [Streptomyces tanashiensis]
MESESPRVQAARRRAVRGSPGKSRKQRRPVARASSAIHPSPVYAQGSSSGSAVRWTASRRSRTARHSSQPRSTKCRAEGSWERVHKSPSQCSR